MAKRVSRDVVPKVVDPDTAPRAARSTLRAPGRYLVRRDEVYFFQVRIPKALATCARIPPLRIKVGVRPRREAQAIAEGMARAAKGVFETLTMLTRGDEFRAEGSLGFDPGSSPQEFHGNILSFIERALAVVSRPPKFTARDLRDGAMWHDLFDLQRQIDRGYAGSQLVQTYATTIRKEIMRRWRISQGYEDEREYDTEAPRYTSSNVVATSPSPSWTAPPVAPAAKRAETSEETPPAPALTPSAVTISSPAPTSTDTLLFSEAAHQYLAWRKGAGADSATLSTARMRLDVYLDLMGDKSIDDFVPRDLQLYVNELQHLPLEFGREGKASAEIRSLGPKAAVERNKAARCWQPMARKTLEDGYIQIVKAVISDAVRNIGCRHPLAGARIAWPANARPSVSREALDDDKLNEVFRRGVASGYIDEALLPALSLTSSRRIGLLAFLRGSDIERKHDVYICRVDGILYDQTTKTWRRVPYKTTESLSYFVLHDLWSRIGFVDWAIAQGDAFLFRQLHATKDPADALSKRMNRLLTASGAKGQNVEVAHSFRHGAKNMMKAQLDGETVRKQMGHSPASDDAHAGYGAPTELLPDECRKIARMPLPTSINWRIFEGLDFEAMAAKPRQRGRKGSDDSER